MGGEYSLILRANGDIRSELKHDPASLLPAVHDIRTVSRYHLRNPGPGWAHLAVTFNAVEHTIYLNGKKRGSSLMSSREIGIANSPIVVMSGGGQPPNQLLAHARVFDYALTPAQIALLYGRELPEVTAMAEPLRGAALSAARTAALAANIHSGSLPAYNPV